jgi:hypothetical protein
LSELAGQEAASESAALTAIAEPSAPLELLQPLVEVPAEVPATEVTAHPESTPADSSPSLIGELLTKKPADTPAVADPVSAPVYELAAPNGVTIPETARTKAREIFTKANLTPEVAEQLWQAHIDEVRAIHESETARQWQVFGETRRDWRKQIEGDQELGGAGYMTVAKSVRNFLLAVIPEEKYPAFDRMLSDTGAGDNPEMLRFLLYASRYADRRFKAATREAGPITPNIGSVPQSKTSPSGRGGLRAIYDETPSR